MDKLIECNSSWPSWMTESDLLKMMNVGSAIQDTGGGWVHYSSYGMSRKLATWLSEIGIYRSAGLSVAPGKFFYDHNMTIDQLMPSVSWWCE